MNLTKEFEQPAGIALDRPLNHPGGGTTAPGTTAWGAIAALTFSIVVLLVAELLPASILTPMAEGLGISQGLAGQTLTVTAIAAIFSSLLLTRVARGIDRRQVILGFMVLMVASNLLVALAPNFTLLLFGRLLLGLALGGLWAIATSVTMRLAPEPMVPRALSVVFGGISVAMVIAAPLGSYFGAMVGWRGVFGATAVLSLLGGIWLYAAMPALPAEREGRGRGILAVAQRPGMKVALLAMMFVFAGQFTFFSYMRPFFEQVTGLGVAAISGVFLLFGVANFIGTVVCPPLLRMRLKATLAAGPALIGLFALILASAGYAPWIAAVMIALWGVVFGSVPVGWSTWIARNLPDDVENAGGLQVAVIQLANAAGAAWGGYLLEAGGATMPLFAAAALMLAAAFVSAVRLRTR